ncbi:IclR family transcriptional regulator [Paraburkholderia susongensis]|uniref:Transcriptional regulator, IclR family n=1 Tax=Paraburkholderia susongensis TaxID=1515439 RepID=A0A1X7LQ87_9BURK|nr:IclR family transcriptional regulator [Paraburkholderia susongensis]SMG56038.1 transcriptional regulator, IclR family [Paraburkholderia susongensis]
MTAVRDRALAIVELLAHNVHGLPMSEVGDRLGIPRTAAHRLLTDLKETGYVKQDPNSSQYMLTVKLASLGLSYLSATGITDAAQPLLDDLAEASGELVRLAVVEGDDLIWVAKAQGARTGLRYDPDAGLEIYLPATANGMAFLAALDEERALSLVSRQGMERAREMGPGAPQSLRALMAQIEQARERGFAVVFDAYEAGTSAVAAAIRIDENGEPIGTVSIAGPSIRMTPERMEVLGPQVCECAKALALASRSSPMFARRPSAA